MAISFVFENTKKPVLPYSLIKKWLISIINGYGKKTGDLTFIFCNDDYLIDINKTYLNHDYYTDIITFDYCELLDVSGDIFISLERVFENSQLFNVTFLDELLRVLVHGILHLQGYSDSTSLEKEVMRALETKFILTFKNL